MPKQFTLKDFLYRARKVHGKRYDYSKVAYSSANVDVEIVCRKHGPFPQRPANHWNGSGCPKCANEETAEKQRNDPAEFLARCALAHNNKYDYSRTQYTKLFAPMNIVCPEHGEFWQQASNHEQGHGCPKCKSAAHGQRRTHTHEEWIALALEVHGDRFEYPERYVKGHQYITVRCKKHDNPFKIMGYSHIAGAVGCKKCVNKGISKIEKRLADFVKLHTNEVITNTRSVIAPLELDIFLPRLRLAIELNGDYWHSAERKGKDAHINKALRCASKGIRLIQFWESDITRRKPVVASMVLNALGKSKSIYARKTELREVSADEAKAFQESTHLQGYSSSSVRYGLYIGRELVACMTFGRPRFTGDYDWELIRFSTKLGHTVVGGASKLLAHFRKQHKGSIVTYANLMISKGDLYRSLGFRYSHRSEPGYRWNSGTASYPRYQTQKHKLGKLLGPNFDPRLSESQNMKRAGFIKVYDAGNLVFTMDK